MRMNVSIFLLTTVFIATFSLLSSRQSDAKDVGSVTDNTIKMGVLCTMTGPAAQIVTQILEGINIHNEYINDQGGIHGRKVKLIVEDDRYSIPTAIAGFKKLVFNDNILALYGPSATGAVVALSRQIEKNQIPTLPYSQADTLVVPFKRYIFTVAATYSDSMNVIVDYIVKDLNEKNPKIALVYPDIEAGKSDLIPALKRLESYGIKPTVKEVLNYDAFDAATQVMSMKMAKIDYVIMCGQFVGTAVVLLRDAPKYDFKPKKVFGSYATCDEDTIKGAGKAAKPFIGVHVMNSWYDDTPGLAELRKITLKYRPGTESKRRTKFFVFGWVMDWIYKEGLQRAGRDLKHETLIDGMEGVSLDTNGLCGPIRYSSTSHKGGESWRLFKPDIEKGILVPISGWLRPSR